MHAFSPCSLASMDRVHAIRRGARAWFVAIAPVALYGCRPRPSHRTTSVPAATPWDAAVQTIDPRETLETVLKGRFLLWRAGLDLAGDHWLLGAGLGAFPRFLSGYPGSAGPENAHNYFIQVLAEAGAMGLAGLAFLLVAIALAVWPLRGGSFVSRSRLAVGLSVESRVSADVLTGHALTFKSTVDGRPCWHRSGAIGSDTRTDGSRRQSGGLPSPVTGLHRIWTPRRSGEGSRPSQILAARGTRHARVMPLGCTNGAGPAKSKGHG